MKITGYRCLRTFLDWGRPVTIDEDAIAANQRTGRWAAPDGPHVRSRRAGLRLVADAPAGADD